MREEEIIKFLKENIEPLTDRIYGDGYRAAVYLTDGTYLPCVIFRKTEFLVKQAIKRFKEEQTGKSIFAKLTGPGYPEIVKIFVASGNKINHYDIKSVEKSKYAFPPHIQKQIHGETSMSWTAFVAKLKDGKHIGFGTAYINEFFDMPDEYSVDDIVEIINDSYAFQDGKVVAHRDSGRKNMDKAILYREKPYFDCYLDSL
jgi:hypothetical protein